jgi:hypothetical protein
MINISELGQIQSFHNGMDENYESTLNERSEDIGDREINLKKIDNIEFDQIDYGDSPDFSDAYILSAHMDGKPMTEGELDILNENREFVHEKLMNYLY